MSDDSEYVLVSKTGESELQRNTRSGWNVNDLMENSV